MVVSDVRDVLSTVEVGGDKEKDNSSSAAAVTNHITKHSSQQAALNLLFTECIFS